MRTRAGLMAVAIGLMLALPMVAEAQSACGNYRVKRGDTLYSITLRAYGFDNVRRVFRANARAIGGNPNVIETGTVLWLPCVESAGAGGTSRATANGPVSLVTATGFAPYVDEAMPGGGLLAELVAMALRRSGSGREAEVVFINDRGAHLEQLLPRGAFDGSFPWPVCEDDCNGYVSSNALLELTEGVFAASGSPLLEVVDVAGLDGTLVCRPEGMLPPGMAVSHSAATVEGCFELLANGVVDLVAVDTRAGDRALAAMRLSGSVEANPYLVTIVPMAVAVPERHPDAGGIVEAINRGLDEMLASGEWDSIVSRGLQANGSAGATTN